MVRKIGLYIDQLSLRERILLVLSVASVVVMLMDMQFLRPIEKKKKSLGMKIMSYQQQIEEIGERLSSFGGSSTESGEMSYLGSLKSENKRLSGQIEYLSSKLAQKEDAIGIMKIYAKPGNQSVEITAMKTIHPVQIEAKPAEIELETLEEENEVEGVADEGKSDLPWFRHGLIVRAEGDSESVAHYMKALDMIPKKLALDTVLWTRKDDQTAELTLQAYTVSNEPYWLWVE